jgi:hypothetical protein
VFLKSLKEKNPLHYKGQVYISTNYALLNSRTSRKTSFGLVYRVTKEEAPTHGSFEPEKDGSFISLEI